MGCLSQNPPRHRWTDSQGPEASWGQRGRETLGETDGATVSWLWDPNPRLPILLRAAPTQPHKSVLAPGPSPLFLQPEPGLSREASGSVSSPHQWPLLAGGRQRSANREGRGSQKGRGTREGRADSGLIFG